MAVVDRPRLLREVHLRLVGADEDVRRRAVDDLPREHVRGGEVEAHRAAARGVLYASRDRRSSASVRLIAADTVIGAVPPAWACERRSSSEECKHQQR